MKEDQDSLISLIFLMKKKIKSSNWKRKSITLKKDSEELQPDKLNLKTKLFL